MLRKLGFYGQFLEKYSNIDFHENPSNEKWVAPCGRTDGHDEANSSFFTIMAKSLNSITSIFTHNAKKSVHHKIQYCSKNSLKNFLDHNSCLNDTFVICSMTCTGDCNYSLCTPDDGCGRHPKHVERLGSKTNRDCFELHLVGLLNT